jgi:hypothetical protein
MGPIEEVAKHNVPEIWIKSLKGLVAFEQVHRWDRVVKPEIQFGCHLLRGLFGHCFGQD